MRFSYNYRPHQLPTSLGDYRKGFVELFPNIGAFICLAFILWLTPAQTLLAQCQGFSVDITSNPPPPHNLCAGQNITLISNVTGGTPPYTYAWTNGATTPTNVITPPVNGSEMLAVTDDNGCLAENSFHLKATVWTVDLFYVGQTVCEGDFMTINAYPDFPAGTTFLWSTGSTNASIDIASSGTYSLTATSPGGGCSGTVSEFVQMAIFPTPNLNITGATQLCSGQNGTLSVNSNPGDSFAWSTGATTSSISISSAGTYSVTVTNDWGCTGTDAVVVTSGSSVTPTLTAPSSLCNGQSGTIQVTNSASFNDFEWNTGATTPSISVSTAGTYSVTVTAPGGCTGTGSVVVQSGSSNMNLAGSTTTSTSCSSPNGSINLTVSPSGSYDFDWSNGATTEDLSGIAAGNYTVTVSDPGGCTASASFAVAENVVLPSATAIASPASCGQSNGGIDLSVSPSGSYAFEWSNGATTEDLANIAAGSYAVTVTNTVTGCSATANATVANTTTTIAVSGNVTHPSNGLNNGAIDVTASPAGNYTYDWSNGANTEDLTGLGAGTYVVTVSAGGYLYGNCLIYIDCR
ncbi:MAG: hypothetical protein IPN76_02885 [Saprospiraceae bacterium]|nr:hypothetical protein [Saprospiraceae bacterium]